MRTFLAVVLALLPAIALGQPAAGIHDLVAGRSSARITVTSPIGEVAATIPAAGTVRVGAAGVVTGGSIVFDAAKLRAEALVVQQLRGPEGFDVARHPEATFALDGGRIHNGRITLEGRLTVRGTTRPVRLTGNVLRARGRRMSAELAGTIDRTAFGIVAGRPLYSRQAQVLLRLLAERRR